PPPPKPPSEITQSSSLRAVGPPPAEPQAKSYPVPPPPPKPPSGVTPAKGVSAPEPARITPEGHALVELLTARVERLGGADDAVGLARVRLELAIVHETIGDDARVNAEAEAALAVDPELAPARAILRRRIHHRTHLATMHRHLDTEI